MLRSRRPRSTRPRCDGSIGTRRSAQFFRVNGGSTQNRIKETLALEDKARNDLDAARRGVALGTRQAFFGLQSVLAQVKALEAAEASSGLHIGEALMQAAIAEVERTLGADWRVLVLFSGTENKARVLVQPGPWVGGRCGAACASTSTCSTRRASS